MCRWPNYPWILGLPYQPGSIAFPFPFPHNYPSFSSAFLSLRTEQRERNGTTLQNPHASPVVVHAPTLPVWYYSSSIKSGTFASLIRLNFQVPSKFVDLQNLSGYLLTGALLQLPCLLLYNWSNSQGSNNSMCTWEWQNLRSVPWCQNAHCFMLVIKKRTIINWNVSPPKLRFFRDYVARTLHHSPLCQQHRGFGSGLHQHPSVFHRWCCIH